MSDTNDFFPASDDLSETLTAPVRQALPQDEQLARIRALDGAAPIAKAFKVTCSKCGGRGRFVSYSGRDCGPCYTCKGKGHKETKTNPTVLKANREKAAVRKQNREVENLDAFKAEFPAQWAWIERTAARVQDGNSFGEMIRSFPLKIMQYGYLSSGQMGVVERGMARDAERAAQKATAAPQTAPVSYPNIRAAFEAVRSRGAKKASTTVGDVAISLAPMTGNNPGALYVKWQGQYAGKIVGTTFKGRDASAELLAALALIEADPTAAIKAQAVTNAQKVAEAILRGEEPEVPCGCCGILLTDPESRERGIGPICAGKWGF